MAKSNFLKRIIIGFLIIALIVLMAAFVRLTGIAIFISLYLFEEYNRVKKTKRENRREYMNQRRQELLDGILKKNKKPTPKSD